MEQGKNQMIRKLKRCLLEQGIVVDAGFADRSTTLSMSQLAIELSLVQAGI
ncbi:TPA: hypothetical protein TXJ06_002064 [Streptococcus suis]|nr:hypothetical protein [Streptococcus suis]